MSMITYNRCASRVTAEKQSKSSARRRGGGCKSLARFDGVTAGHSACATAKLEINFYEDKIYE